MIAEGSNTKYMASKIFVIKPLACHRLVISISPADSLGLGNEVHFVAVCHPSIVQSENEGRGHYPSLFPEIMYYPQFDTIRFNLRS